MKAGINQLLYLKKNFKGLWLGKGLLFDMLDSENETSMVFHWFSNFRNDRGRCRPNMRDVSVLCVPSLLWGVYT